MKKIICSLVILFISQLTFANELDTILTKARSLTEKKNYTEAIKEYENYIKLSKGENLKDVYIEVANCYFYQNKKETAVNYIKDAISKYGFTEEDFIYSSILDEKLSSYALSVVYDDYFKLRKKYLATLN
jgi:tetratricopeptide (TPR) repeat protein